MVAPSGGFIEVTPSGGSTCRHSFRRIHISSLHQEDSHKVAPSGGFNLSSLHQEDPHMVAPSGGFIKVTPTGGSTYRHSFSRIHKRSLLPEDPHRNMIRKIYLDLDGCSFRRTHSPSFRKLLPQKDQEISCFVRKAHSLASHRILSVMAGVEAMYQEEAQLYNTAGIRKNKG